AAAAFRRIEGYVVRASEVVDGVHAGVEVPPAFGEAMDDDLSVPQALAVVFDTVREGNRMLSAGERDGLRDNLASVRAMLGVLGLDPLADPWVGLDSVGSSGERLREVVDALVGALLEQRQAARANKDFATADALRDQLRAAGIIVEDSPDGVRWELSDPTSPGRER